MPSYIKSSINKKWASYRTKFLIFGLDIAASAFSIVAAILLSYEFRLEKAGMFYSWAVAVLLGLRVLTFIWFRTYSVVVRYIGEKDLKTVFYAVTSASIGFYLIHGLLPPVLDTAKLVPILLIDYALCLCTIGGVRVLLRLAYDQVKKNHTGSPTAIFGAGELGVMVERILRNNTSHPYRIKAFFDDDPQNYGKVINGVRVFNPEKSFQEIILKYKIQTVILGINSLSPERKTAFINICLEHNIKVLKIPPVELWMNGALNVGQLKNINFEDLLNRAPIELDQQRVKNSIKGRVILVTGCAGSIGSEIVHQLLRYQPAKVIGLDQAETPLANITLKLKDEVEQGLFLPIIGDVRDREKIQRIFETHRPVYIFHAAAYKHVPIMELFPEQAIKANVEGTQNMADLAVQYGAEKFVMISTDKVVNPSNVMGASKRIAEIYTQSLNYHEGHFTQFITTRFGNVLGSNGSVIPIFSAQIENREPITLTHPDVSRYFMTIPEACQLVLEAGAMGRGGEIFMFDMGEPVRILDLAHKMIQVAGLVPGKDIMIEITGLRPGEKITEELLDSQENTLPTHHPKILKAEVRICDYKQVKPEIDLLIHYANSGIQGADIVQHMKYLVPEYTSQNSKYSSLDIAVEKAATTLA